jgi:hypothetical protein
MATFLQKYSTKIPFVQIALEFSFCHRGVKISSKKQNMGVESSLLTNCSLFHVGEFLHPTVTKTNPIRAGLQVIFVGHQSPRILSEKKF